MLVTTTVHSSSSSRAVRSPASSSRRHGRELVIVDVAVPRDVDPAGELPGVTLLDMDDIGVFVEQQMARAPVSSAMSRRSSGRGRSLSQRHLRREVAPLIAQLRTRGNDIADIELARFNGKLSDSMHPSARPSRRWLGAS